MSKTGARHSLFQLLSSNYTHRIGTQVVTYGLVLLILLNALAVMLETVPIIALEWGSTLHWFERFSVAVFTVEYLIRVWTCVEDPHWHSHPHKHCNETPHWKIRLRYVVSPMAIIDLLAILPFYLSMFFAVDLRVLRLFRLIRLVKIGRYSRSIQLLVNVLQREGRVLLAALMVLLIIMVIAATGMYHLEHTHQPEAFGSIPSALWWSLATLTTVGYGDVVPITPLGKMFGGVIIILGVAIFAVPAGILASSFSEQLHIRRSQFRKEVLSALADGKIDARDLRQLNQLRKALDLDQQEADVVIGYLREQYRHEHHETCPHCGHALHSKMTPTHRRP